MITRIVKVKTDKGQKLFNVQVKYIFNWNSAFYEDKNGKIPKYFKSKKKAKNAEKELILHNKSTIFKW